MVNPTQPNVNPLPLRLITSPRVACCNVMLRLFLRATTTTTSSLDLCFIPLATLPKLCSKRAWQSALIGALPRSQEDPKSTGAQRNLPRSAKCVDWSIAKVTGGPEKYRSAEKLAKERKVRLWKDYKAPAGSVITGDKEFNGKVVEVVNGDALV